MGIDVHTIFLLFTFGNILVVLCFGIYLLIYRPKNPILVLFVVAKVFGVLYSLFFALRMTAPYFISVVLSNVLGIIGICLEAYCVINANKKFNRRHFIRFLVFPASLSVIFLIFHNTPYEYLRVALMSIILIIIFCTAGSVILLDKQRSKVQTMAVYFYYILTFLFLLRAIWAMEINLELYSTATLQVITYFAFYFISFGWVVLLMLIIKERDNQQMAENNLRLKELNAKKDKLFMIIAHDLKNPIGGLAMLGEALILNYDGLDKKRREKIFNVIADSCKGTYTLLDNLLQWSRSETGLLEVNKTRLDFKEIIESNLNLLKELIDLKNIEVRMEIGPNDAAYGDYNMINTVIRNLLSNAIKFTPENGKIYIHSEHIPAENTLRISVEDTGIGIPDAAKNKIFDLDSNYTTRGTHDETGTGLGLKLCREFIERNHGKITVESEPGEGSIFSIEIPTVLIEEKEEPA